MASALFDWDAYYEERHDETWWGISYGSGPSSYGNDDVPGPSWYEFMVELGNEPPADWACYPRCCLPEAACRFGGHFGDPDHWHLPRWVAALVLAGAATEEVFMRAAHDPDAQIALTIEYDIMRNHRLDALND